MRRLPIALLVLACACSSKSKDNPSTDKDAGGGGDDTTDSGPVPEDKVVDHGVMLEFDTKQPLPGVTVTEGDVSTTTNDKGEWSLQVPKNKPLWLSMTIEAHTSLLYPEVLLSGDTDRGPVTSVKLTTFQFVANSLDNFNPDLGVLYLGVRAKGGCADATGATVKVTSPSNAVAWYFGSSSIPSKTQTSVLGKQDPAVAIYNIELNTPITVELTHPTCKAAAFPYTDGTITYTGTLKVEGKNSNSYAPMFLE